MGASVTNSPSAPSKTSLEPFGRNTNVTSVRPTKLYENNKKKRVRSLRYF